MDRVLHGKARLESSQDNGVASQACSLSNNIQFYIADLSVPAEMISLLNAVSRKVTALDSLVSLITCFLHLSLLKKQLVLIEMPRHFLLSAGHTQRYLGANREKGTSQAVASLSSHSWSAWLFPWILEGKWHYSEWKEHWSLYLKCFLLHLLLNNWK